MPWTRTTIRTLALAGVVGASLPSLAAPVDEPTSAEATEAPERLTGRMIADRILERLRADPAVGADQIGVVVVDGEVTVSGGVPSLEVKQRAERIAESVTGVKSVRNRLRVRVNAPHTDRQLTHYVERALRTDPATSGLDIEASSKNGVVTLKGQVPSLAQKQLAGEIAADLFAVRAVRNRLSVTALDEARDAAEIAADVRAALDWDARLDGSRLAVRVEEQTVVLEGAVSSAAARRHAIEDAWVRGVTAVKGEGLVVDPARASIAGDERQASANENAEEELRQAIQRSFANHPRLAGTNVEVSVDPAGRVTLRGVVASVKAKRTAGELVVGRLGVRDVRNRLYVDPAFTPALGETVAALDENDENAEGTTAMLAEADEAEKAAAPASPMLNDGALAEELLAALRRDAYLSGRRIDVDVIRGHAYLAGDVESAFERARAEDVAARLRGVVTIHNEIGVQPAAVDGEAGGATPHDGTPPIYEWSDS